MKRLLFLTAAVVSAACAHTPTAASANPATTLFDGHSLAGWEGGDPGLWRVVDGAIVGGSLTEPVPHNDFLATTRSFENFDLHLQIKLTGKEGFCNAGIQFRSKRVPDSFEVCGYQADFGAGYDGALYDESRRNRVLAMPDKAAQRRALKPGEWNDYRIRVDGNRIQLWLNGEPMVDYTETQSGIDKSGIIALQIHGGGKTQVAYRNIVIQTLTAP